MLSNRVVFLVIRLILMFVLATMVPSAMAGFGVSMRIDAGIDVSAERGIQVMRGEPIKVRVEFEEVVIIGTAAANFSASDILVTAYNEFGGEETAPTLTEPIAYDPSNSDSKHFVITVSAPGANVKKVILYMPKYKVESVDRTGKSNEASIEIDYVGTDEAAPQVYSIRRANSSSFLATTETVRVIIQLSEKPAAFTKDHISATNATHGAPIFLGSVREEEILSTGHDGQLYFYVVPIMPKYETDNDIIVKVKAFEDTVLPAPNRYTPPLTDGVYREGIDKLTIKVDRTVLITETTGSEVSTVKTTTAVGEKAKSEATQTTADASMETEITQTTTNTDTTTVATVPDTSVMIPMEGRIYISEIMFAGGGSLPQWIEISNGSRTEQVNLSGWIVQIESAHADANVPTMVKFKIPGGTKIDPSGQHDTPSTILIVSKQGRNNLEGAMAEGQVVKQDRQWSLSDMAFRITLAPPSRVIFTDEQAAARAAVTDVVGNLTEDSTVAWALPMNESGARSSILRRHVPGSMDAAEPKDGVMMESWVLASDTGFTQGMHVTTQSYYGLPTDIGTPGFRAGGALPVELSHFRPERQKETGQVVITWSTQSELNNAGFFIKRSQQRDGEFRVINVAMIPGAGTTSEKQFYTYTDTTAERNIVYYYQIEDVSFDGERQVLTRGIRLRGHVGAADKATVMWGELKGR